MATIQEPLSRKLNRPKHRIIGCVIARWSILTDADFQPSQKLFEVIYYMAMLTRVSLAFWHGPRRLCMIKPLHCHNSHVFDIELRQRGVLSKLSSFPWSCLVELGSFVTACPVHKFMAITNNTTQFFLSFFLLLCHFFLLIKGKKNIWFPQFTSTLDNDALEFSFAALVITIIKLYWLHKLFQSLALC